MPRGRPYTTEFRRQMVDSVRSGRTAESLSREFEPSAQTIRDWVRQREHDEGRGDDGLTSAEREELNRLRREVRRLRVSRANQAASFAKTSRSSRLPEDLAVAEFKIILNIDGEQHAREKAELLFAEVRSVFYARNVALALLYEIEFEIIGAERGSWEFLGNVRLRLKEEWKALKKKAPKAFVTVSAILVAVAGYPDLREGAILIGKDVKSAYEYVIDQDKVKEPDVIKYFECHPPASDDQAPMHAIVHSRPNQEPEADT